MDPDTEPRARHIPVGTDDLVWYVSYGSNMFSARLACYLEGGRPPGATRTYRGARDPSPPRARRAVRMPGTVYFARWSSVWGGGAAFYDPTGPGTAAACAQLVTLGQFSDIAAQESRREPGTDLDLTEVLRTGRAVCGDGWYDTLVLIGWHDDVPMLTFTSPSAVEDTVTTAPSGAYLRMIVDGLIEAHGWSPAQVADYLCSLPGCAGAWTREEVDDLARDAPISVAPMTIDPDLKALATGKNFAALTTLMADGQPQTQIMWVHADDEHVLINTEVGRQKFRNVQRDPRVTVTVFAADNAYQYVEARGVVVETIEGEVASTSIDELSDKYMGQPYPADTSSRVLLRIAVDKIHKNGLD